MKISEIIPVILEQRALRKQAKSQAHPTLNVGGKAMPNHPLKQGKKRKPYMNPVWMTFELPRRTMLIDGDQESKAFPLKTS